MNLLNSAFVSMAGNPLKRAAGDTPSWPFLRNLTTTQNGKRIDVDHSLKISAFWCGVNTIANSLALLPKHVMQKRDKNREIIKDHPVDFIIHNEPNARMTAFSFWFSFTVCILIKGAGFARIVRNGNGDVSALELWNPTDVSILDYNGQLFYSHKGNTYLSEEVYHVPNFCMNGITGRGVLQYAADNMGISLAADEFASNSYDNKGVSYGVLETDKELNPNGKDFMSKMFNQSLNTEDKHRLTVFDEGMKYKRITLTPAESDFIKAKASGVQDIARWLCIPLHKLHAPGEGGYNFLVQMSIEYIQTAVLPLGQKIKEEAQRKLLSETEKKEGHYIFMNYSKLLEADPKARAQYFKDMVYIKAMNPNEVRELEDLNPYKGGDEFLQMTNLQTQQQIKKETENV
jgi:HK97 family phage portal protein